MEKLVFNKEQHKLEELEKYGFEMCIDVNGFINYVRFKNDIYCAIIDVVTPWFSREKIDIKFYKKYFDKKTKYLKEIKILKRVNKKKLLKDLIKDGLVVKEKK